MLITSFPAELAAELLANVAVHAVLAPLWVWVRRRVQPSSDA